MSKDRKKLLHIHSSVNDKQPTPASIEFGELAINNAKDNAFISTKNSNNKIVRFSEDDTIINWMEMKEVFPYEGYVRGNDSSSSGITESDLLQNKSNIILKMNQVAASNSEYDEKINNAKDIYGNLINPISADGYRDGAGIAIDMSNYAMQGANPSFSSITTTCHAIFNGTTEINGSDGNCGSEFNVNVENICIDADDRLNEYGVNQTNIGTSCDGSNISNNTTVKGKKVLIESPNGDSTVDIKACEQISAKTNNFVVRECSNGQGSVDIDTTKIDISADTTIVNSCDLISASTNVFILKECSNGQGETAIESCKGISAKTNNFVVESCGDGGTTHINSCDEIKLESKNIILTDGECGSGQITVEVDNLCLVGEDKINVYGDETNIGLDCDDSTTATNTRVFGKGMLITTDDNSNVYPERDNVEVFASQDIKENASRNICDQATNEATFYGAAKTKVGVSCDDSVTAETTTVKGNKVIVDASVTDLGLTAKQDIIESSERNITIAANDDICESAGNEALFFGENKTRIGINCQGEKTDKTDITSNNDIEITAGENINITSDGNICESATDSAFFFGGRTTHIGASCNDSKSLEIIYERVPKIGNCEIKATTVDDALDEVFDRDKIHFSESASTNSTTYRIWQDSGSCENSIEFTINDTIVSMVESAGTASSEISKTYTLFQTTGDRRVEIGTIDIPKDHILKDVTVVWGIYNQSTDEFTPCTGDGSENCHWYLKMVWNVFDPQTGHADDKVSYLDMDNFVQDTNVVSTPAITMTKWYDGKINLISADTTIKIGNVVFNKNNGTHSADSYKLSFASGDVKNSFDNIVFDAFDENKNVNIPTDAKHINRNIFSVIYGDVSRKQDKEETYDPGNGTENAARGSIITVPKNVAHLEKGSLSVIHNAYRRTFDLVDDMTWDLGHEELTFTHGDVKDEVRDTIYDTSAPKVVKIPNCVSHLKRKVLNLHYGPTCGENDSTFDAGGYCGGGEASGSGTSGMTVVIPKTISDITNSAIRIDECSGGCISVSGDVCIDGVLKAEILYSSSDKRLKENINNLSHVDYSKSDLIHFKEFNFKNDETKQKTYGVLAQDVISSDLKNIVHTDNDGFMSVDYISLLILKIASLENKVNSLTAQLETLKRG